MGTAHRHAALVKLRAGREEWPDFPGDAFASHGCGGPTRPQEEMTTLGDPQGPRVPM